MKRYLLLLISAMMVFLQMEAVSTACCMLKHDGKITTFYPDDIQKALDNSVDGDTIFLTYGDFPGFTIEKKVTVRGMGANKTYVRGDIHIKIPNNPVLTANVLEDLDDGDWTNSIFLDTKMTGVKLKYCRNFGGFSASVENKNVLIDRCILGMYFLDKFFNPNNIQSMTVKNSSIDIAFSDMTTTNDFINCDINVYNIDKCRGNFINCILLGRNRVSTSGTYKNCSFEYCLITGKYNDTGICQTSYCIKNNDFTDISPTEKELESNHYYGYDGTIMGMHGGSTPWNWRSSMPLIFMHDIYYDNTTRTLKADLKVLAK